MEGPPSVSDARQQHASGGEWTSPLGGGGQSSSHAEQSTPASSTSGSHHDSTHDTVDVKSREFYCAKCDVSFTEKRALLRHERESEKHIIAQPGAGSQNPSRQHRCPECGKSYKRAHDLRRHLDEVHRAKRRRRNNEDDAAPGATATIATAEDEQDPGTFTIPVRDANVAPDTAAAAAAEIEAPYEVVQQTPLGPVATSSIMMLDPSSGASGLIEPVTFISGYEEEEYAAEDATAGGSWGGSATTGVHSSLAILKAEARAKRPAPERKSNSSPDLARHLLAQHTRISQDQKAINLAPETRDWLAKQLAAHAQFSVAAFNARDFAFASEEFKSITATLAPDLQFRHHKLPHAFDHGMMIRAYTQMATMNPAWNIRVLGAMPIINLRDRTATIFISSLVTDDGVVWAEQIIEYRFALYSSRWLCNNVTSMRGQRLLGA